MADRNIIEFDSVAHSYDEIHAENIKLSGFPTSYFDEYKIREIGRYLSERGLDKKPVRFLNFGCGIGKSETYIRKYVPASVIYGVDVSTESLARAREKNKGMENVHFEPFDGENLPFQVKFDVIFIANVFHHVASQQHLSLLEKLREALSDNGLLFVFEHNPLNPITVKTIKACPFDKNAVLLSPFYANSILKTAGFLSRNIRFTIFFPYFLSFLLPLEKYLRKFPLGAQYYFIAKKTS